MPSALPHPTSPYKGEETSEQPCGSTQPKRYRTSIRLSSCDVSVIILSAQAAAKYFLLAPDHAEGWLLFAAMRIQTCGA